MNILRNTLLLIMMIAMSRSSLSDSGGNSVYIDQTNADNSTVSITQTGANNTVGDPNNVGTPSFEIEGNSMLFTILQDGMNNAIRGNLIGGGATADITQTGNSNTTDLNMGSMGTGSGTLSLTFTGSNNESLLNIAALHDSSNYSYIATITGSNNILTSTINSKYTDNTFLVTGSYNEITTNQTGANGTNNVVGNNIAISNIGNNNTISVLQDGVTNPNSAIVNLTGDNATVNVVQH
jgi:hypothetical protein